MRLLITLLLPGCFVTTAELESALDRDQDGYQPDVAGGPDCEPENAAVNPDALELCGDGIDNDCDGAIDDRGVGEREWFADTDNDGWGAGDPVLACNPPEGHVAQLGDCNDADAEISPNALDLCDGADQDCDGVVDDDATFQTLFRDADGDGFGTDETLLACGNPSGYADVAGDCDDGNGAIQPGISDFCDGIDQDCDGAIDEDATFTIYFEDSDDDGVGTVDEIASTCDGPPLAYVSTAGDCDDLDPTVVIPSWYPDLDGDGHGAGQPTQSCVPPLEHVSTGDDCDDSDGLRSPSRLEVCENGIDDDCSAETHCRPTGTLILDEAPVHTFGGDDTVSILSVGDVVGGPEPDVFVSTATGVLIVDGSSLDFANPTATYVGRLPHSARDITGDERPEFVVTDDGGDRADVYVPPLAGIISPFLSVTNVTGSPGTRISAAGGDWAAVGAGVWIAARPTPGTQGELRFIPWAAGTVDGQIDWTERIQGAPGQELGRHLATLQIDEAEGLLVEDGTELLGLSNVSLATTLDTGTVQWDWAVETIQTNGAIAIGDFDRWGRPEALFKLTFDFELLDFHLDVFPDGGMQQPELTVRSPPNVLATQFPVGDLDGDGFIDFALLDFPGQILAITHGDPGSIESTTSSYLIRPNPNQAVWALTSLAGHDFDLDGYSDLLIVSTPNGDPSSRAIHVIRGTGQ